MLLQGFDELAHIAFGDIPAYSEFVADFVDNGGFGRPGFKKLKDSRANEVEVEHLALPNIQDNGAILTVCTADAL